MTLARRAFHFAVFTSLLSCCGSTASWAQTNTSWSLAGPGIWNSSSNWSGGFVPFNGNNGTNWNVFINNGNVVDLNTSVTINQLNVAAGNGLSVLNGASLTISNTGQPGAGMVNNDGNVTLAGTGGSTLLNFFGTTSFNGSGTISLAGGGSTRISGSGTLTNGANHTIQGSGNVGNNALLMVNSGTIQAGSGEALLIDPANAGGGNAGLNNLGSVKASGGGTVTLTGSGFGEFHGSGVYLAEANSTIELTTLAIARNTNFNTSGNGQVNIASGQTISWHDVNNLGNTFVRNNAYLDLYNSFNNQGTVLIDSSGADTQLRTFGTVNLTGGGNVILNHPNARIGGSGVLTNQNNTISGTGNVGFNSIRIVNPSLIQAGSGQSLVIDPANGGAGNFGLDNQGVVKATGGGTVTLTGSGFGEFHGSGVYLAEANSSVDLTSSAVARSTNFNSTGNGQINIVSGQTISWHDVNNLGNTFVRSNAYLDLYSSFNNQGTVLVNSSGADTQLRAIGTVSLTGGGSVVLNHVNARIGGSGLLTNQDNTISGIGNVGFNSIRIVNQSLIQAGSGQNLVIDPANAGAGNFGLDNQSVVKATGGGTVTLTGSGFGEFHGSGVYLAEANSAIDLTTSAVARNTNFDTSGNGQINMVSGQTISWHDVNNLGNSVVRNNAYLDVYNSFNNQGTVLIDSSGADTQLRVIGSVNLTGGGNIVLSQANARIGGSGVLTNQNNTISGTGNVGLNTIRIVNQSLIQAGNGQNLVIDPANAGAGNIGLDNLGTIRAVNGGTVTLTGSGFGEFAGAGTFEAHDNSGLIFDSSAIVQNVTGGVLGSGTWRAIAGGSGAQVRIQNNATSLINTIGAGAAVELSGVNSNFTVRSTNVSIDSTLNQLDGQLAIRNGRNMNLSGGLIHSGNLTVDASTLVLSNDFNQLAGTTTLVGGGSLDLTAGSNNVVSGGVFGGNGTVVGDVLNSAGAFQPGLSPGQLNVTGDYTQSAAASLLIEIGGLNQGVNFDHLFVGNNAFLDGQLVVSLWGGFTPSPGDTFEVLTSQALSGVFSNAGLQIAVQGGGSFDVTYTGTSVILGNYNAVPEPSSLAFIGLTWSVLLLRRRRWQL